MGVRKPPVKHIADIVGEWGIWQFQLSTFYFLQYACGAINNMGYSFHAFNNDFYCKDVPKDYPNKTNSMKCFQFSNPGQPCNEWHYNRSEFHTSIITEFDLVCDRSNFGSISQSFYMLGFVFSGLVFAHYSDKFGRRPIIWISLTIELIGIISSALSVNIYMYCLSRFLIGMGSSGRGLAVYTTLMECCGPKYRADIALLGGIGWVFGYVLIPGLAYWLQNFRYMQMASILPMILMMIWFYFLHESPRWQITNGRVDEAEITLRKALKLNGKPDQNLKEQLSELSSELRRVQSDKGLTKTYNILDLLRTRTLRRITLIMWYSSVVNALIYYGFSFNMSDFGGNFYLTFLLSGLVELPSQLITPLLLRFIGRRKLFSLFFTLTAVSSFSVIPSKSEFLKVTFALLGKFSINSSYCVMGIQNPELLPTVLRHTGMGSSHVVSRIGAIVAPFMKNLAVTSGLAVVMILYGTLTSVGAILVLFQPETKGREIPDTIEEVENCRSIELKNNSSEKS